MISCPKVVPAAAPAAAAPAAAGRPRFFTPTIYLYPGYLFHPGVKYFGMVQARIGVSATRYLGCGPGLVRPCVDWCGPAQLFFW